ncbi:MAG TPA: hypothetical protein VG406_11360 [Isosphaeraceae bacterium]|jgi:hypothetical protein|nr:hypothetical protein [Isosphaeraceae bacterium]
MTIMLPCGGCGRRLKVAGAWPGATIACPQCGHRSTIPAPAAAEARPIDAAPDRRRSPAVTAAVVGGTVVSVVVAVGLGVWFVLEHGSRLGADPGNPNDTVAPLSAELDQQAREGPLRFASPEQERAYLEGMRRQEAFAGLLAEVKDRGSAERLAPKIKDAFRDLIDFARDPKNRLVGPSPAVDELVRRHKERADRAQKAIRTETARLDRSGFAGPVERAMNQVLRELAQRGVVVSGMSSPAPAKGPAAKGPPAGVPK